MGLMDILEKDLSYKVKSVPIEEAKKMYEDAGMSFPGHPAGKLLGRKGEGSSSVPEVETSSPLSHQ